MQVCGGAGEDVGDRGAGQPGVVGGEVPGGQVRAGAAIRSALTCSMMAYFNGLTGALDASTDEVIDLRAQLDRAIAAASHIR
jgi:hypothetical protein